jgi:hypothetical protein
MQSDKGDHPRHAHLFESKEELKNYAACDNLFDQLNKELHVTRNDQADIRYLPSARKPTFFPPKSQYREVLRLYDISKALPSTTILVRSRPYGARHNLVTSRISSPSLYSALPEHVESALPEPATTEVKHRQHDGNGWQARREEVVQGDHGQQGRDYGSVL